MNRHDLTGTVVSWSGVDEVGTVRATDGRVLRFGGSAMRHIRAAAGMSVLILRVERRREDDWVVELRPLEGEAASLYAAGEERAAAAARRAEEAERSRLRAETMTADEAWRQIEEQRSFRVPELYRQLVARGLTTYGEPASAVLLCCPEVVEWRTPGEMAEWRSREWWLPELNLLRFATDGAGSDWCWVGAHADRPGGPPVVFVPKHDDVAEVYAANIQEFLFRMLLESMHAFVLEDESAEWGHASLRAQVDRLGDLLTPAMHTELQQVLARPTPPPTDDEGFLTLQLLSAEEVRATFGRAADASIFGTTIRYRSE